MNKNILHLGTALLLIVIIFSGSYVFETGFFGLIKPTLEQYAERVIDSCAKESYPPGCYDKEIPKLMDTGLTMEESFEVTRIIQGKVGNYFYCHVLGHNLAAKETAKDPTKWTEVIARCPVGMCSNGCLHGAAQERFRSDVLTDAQIQSLVPELSQVCESGHGRDFTGLEQASCYHSLGHLSMYISGARIPIATNVCDQMPKVTDDYAETCYEGAFMQIFQPLEPEDFALVKEIPATTTALAEVFCDSYSGMRRAACHRESWPLYRDTLTKPGGLESFCTLMPGPEYEGLCYNAMFFVLTAQFDFDEKKIVELCESVPEKRIGQCFSNAASRELETDYHLIPKAVAICGIADAHGVGERCYKEMLFYSHYNFHKGSDGFNALCRALPEPWGTQCASGEAENARSSQKDL